MRAYVAAILVLIFLGVSISVPVGAVEYTEKKTSLLISSIKTDGGIGKESIVIYNPTDEAVALDGWQIDYIKPNTPLENAKECSAVMTLSLDDMAKQKVVGFSGGNHAEIAARTSFRITNLPMNDNAGGMVRLSQIIYDGDEENLIVHDLVGWGSSASAPWCYEGESFAPIAKDKEELVRCTLDGEPSDTNENSKDFFVIASMAAETGMLPECPSEEDTPQQKAICASELRLSEILPDPAAPQADAEHEFIEITNSGNEIINLQGCYLANASGTTSEALPDYELLPGEYIAFYISETRLGLSNKGGYVTLVDRQGVVIDQADAYPKLKSGWSWALIDGIWQATNRVSPDGANTPTFVLKDDSDDEAENTVPCPEGKYRSLETNRCRKIEAVVAALAPCDEDEERSHITNRCRKAAVLSATTAPCRQGYERSSETNRCRKVAGSDAGLKPCDPGKERNPETNRCRAVASVAASLKPCPEGQERNAETKRCRKVSQASAVNEVSDVGGNPKGTLGLPPQTGWWLVGLSVAGVLGYGVYEWRQEAAAGIRRLREKFLSK